MKTGFAENFTPKRIIVSDTSTDGIATVNPYRYRTYYYDSEIGMYYLQSRYYDPMTGRFINADKADILTIGIQCLGNNLFVYDVGLRVFLLYFNKANVTKNKTGE